MATTNAKESKQNLIDGLTGLTQKKGYDKMPKEIRDRIAYTTKKFAENAKNVTLATLTELTNDVRATLDAMRTANAEAKAKAEAEAKAKAEADAAAAKKQPVAKKEKAKPVAAQPVAAAVEASPKKLQKPVTKKPVPAPKKPEVVAAPAGTKAEFAVAKYFPDEIEIPDYGKLVKVPSDKFKDFAAMRKFLNDNGTLFMATYWTKRHIKEYSYGPSYEVDAPKEFPLNLDILNPIAVCDKLDRVWTMSVYTEAVVHFNAPDFEPVEDIDAKTGEKFLVRVSAGMEFELYMPAK